MDEIGLSYWRFTDYLWKHNNADTGEIKKGREVVGIFIQNLTQYSIFLVYPSLLEGYPKPLPSSLWSKAQPEPSCFHSSYIHWVYIGWMEELNGGHMETEEDRVWKRVLCVFARELWGMCVHTHMHTYMHTLRFHIWEWTCTMFTIAKLRNQPRCPPAEEQIQKMGSIYT